MSEALDPDQIRRIGHDVRKPLISLISTANLLLSGLEGELPQQVQRDVEKMKINAEQALKSIDRAISVLKQMQ